MKDTQVKNPDKHREQNDLKEFASHVHHHFKILPSPPPPPPTKKTKK